MSTKRQANFYDLSTTVYTNTKDGFCDKSDIIPLYKNKELLKRYILENNILFGDIIFIGGESDRQEYCFEFVGENGNTLNSNYASHIIFEKKYQEYLDKLKTLNISYEIILNELKNDDFFTNLFFGYEDDIDLLYNSCIEKYKENNLI